MLIFDISCDILYLYICTGIVSNSNSISGSGSGSGSEIKIDKIPSEDLRDYMSNDDQNVHNMAIKKEIKKIMKQLIENDKKKFVINDILLNQSLKEHIEKINYTPIEIEILRLIWERIHDPINIECKNILIDNLIIQLKDIISDDSCIQGRIARYLQSLENDNGKIINYTPYWMIKENIVNKIVYMKNKMKSNNYKYLIQYLDYYFEYNYVKTGLLNKNELNNIVSDYYIALIE